jgi:hypothetical protein
MTSLARFSSILTLLWAFNGNEIYSVQAGGVEDFAYIAYFSDSECTKFSAIKGFVSNDPYQITSAGGDGVTCDQAMACFLSPDGSTCQGLGGSGARTNLTIEVREGGVYECDDSNIAVGEPECAVIDPQECKASSSYFGCHFRWMAATSFYDSPEDLIPKDEDPSSGLEMFGYLAYYSTEDCSEIAALRGFVSDEPFQLPIGHEDETCEMSAACVLHPEGSTCQQLEFDTEATVATEANINVEVRDKGGEIYECDDSNIAVGEPECAVIDQQACQSSSVYPTCRFHFRTATNFAMDPADFVSPSPEEGTSSGSSWEVFQPALIVVIGSLFVLP